MDRAGVRAQAASQQCCDPFWCAGCARGGMQFIGEGDRRSTCTPPADQHCDGAIRGANMESVVRLKRQRRVVGKQNERRLTYAILRNGRSPLFSYTHCAWIVAMYATRSALQNAGEHVVTNVRYSLHYGALMLHLHNIVLPSNKVSCASAQCYQ